MTNRMPKMVLTVILLLFLLVLLIYVTDGIAQSEPPIATGRVEVAPVFGPSGIEATPTHTHQPPPMPTSAITVTATNTPFRPPEWIGPPPVVQANEAVKHDKINLDEGVFSFQPQLSGDQEQLTLIAFCLSQFNTNALLEFFARIKQVFRKPL